MLRHRRFLLCFFCAFSFVFPLHAQAPAWVDAHSFGGANNDKTNHVLLDAGNNALYVCGTFRGANLDFDASAGVANLTSNSGGTNDDMFIAKYNATTGAYIWAISVGGNTNSDAAIRMALDGAGNVYVCGTFGGTADFNPLGVPNNKVAAGTQDIFFARYNPGGLCDWATTIGAAATASAALDITVSGTDLYVTGRFTGSINFGGGNLMSAGVDDIFIGKYATATGVYTNAIKVGGTGLDTGEGIIADGLGNVWVTGTLNVGGAVNFNPLGAIFNRTSAGNTDVFVAKYDATLNLVGANMAWLIGGATADAGKSLAVDASNNLYVVGEFSGGVIDFDPSGAFANRNSSGGADGFIASYTSAGAFRWVTTIGTTVGDLLDDVAVAGGNVYVCGGAGAGPLDLDGDVNFTTTIGAGPTIDAYFAWYDAGTGAYKRGKRLIGAGGSEGGLAITADGAGNIYWGGFYSSVPLDMDPRAGSTQNFSNVGLNDAFVLRYNPSAAESYTWNSGVGAWILPTNWTPQRDNPCADDILIFPLGTWLANNTPWQQVGRIIINSGAEVTWQAVASGMFILVNGDAAPFDVDIQPMGTLTLGAGANEAALRVTTGSVCNVAGTLKIGSLPNPRSYIGGWGTLNVTNTGSLSTRGPNGINGLLGLQNGVVQIDVASGGVINYDNAASYSFEGKGITGFQAIALKPAITQAQSIKITPTLVNERVMLDNSVTLSGALNIGGPGSNIGLSVTSANVLTLSAVPSVIDATTSPKVLEVISGTVNIPVAGGLTFVGANPRLVLCSDGSMGTAGLLTGNPPTYAPNALLEYNINDANRTTTDVEIPVTMNGRVLINGFAGTAPMPIVTLNNGKTLNQAVTVSNGTFSLGGGGTSINNTFVVGNAAPASSGKVNLNNLTLTLNNNTTTLNASTFIGSATSSLTLGNGNDSFTGNLTFDPGARQLNIFTVNLGAANTVNLGSDVSVGGQLTLTQGIITGTSPVNFLRVTSNLPSSVSRTNGWVAGPLERQMQANVSVDGTNYLFPIGDAVNYRPASLQNVRTGAGTPQIRMTYAAAGASTFSAPVTALASAQNWRVETVVAGFTNSAIALDNGALPPVNSRVGQSGAQVGMYATINGGAIGNVVTSDPLLATPNQFYAIVTAPGVGPYLVAPAPVPATNSNTSVFGAMTDITLSYNENMNPPAAANMFVHGSQRGYRTGATFSQPSATQLRTTLPAARTLAPGEQVTVTVTNATSAVTGSNPRPHVYSFLARTGIGPAQFFELQRPAVGLQPRSVVSADFNNDGRLDLCVANSGTNDLSVLLGGVGGVFGAPVTVMLPGFTSPSNIVAADFNNDGNVDIAVSCSPNVCVLVGNGAGGFAAPVGYASGPGGPRYGLTARDFNGDGNVDILVGNAGAGPGNISVLPNTGAATFGAPITSPTIPNAFSVAAGDIDNDGDIDAIAVQSFGSNGFTIAVNNGLGTFALTATPTLAAAYDVSMGDFNGDGWLDFAVSQYSVPNQVAIYLNTGYGVFPALPNSTYTTGDGVSSVVVGDYNGDGALDLVTSNELSNSISVLIGNNTGAFSPAANFVTGAGPRSWSAAGDFDGDGDLDFATANFVNNSVSILLNTTQPRFVCVGGCGPVTYAPNIVPQRNVNNALTASLLTWQFTEPMKSTSLVNAPEAFRVFGGVTGKRTGTWSYNSGTTTATLTPASPFRPGEQVMVSVTAAQSAIGINARPFVYQYRNRAGVGPATFYTVQTHDVLNTQTWSIVTGYFNADSYLDVAVNGIGGTIGIEVFFGNASGGFSAGGILGGGTRYCGLEVADMNGDGTLDIVGATYGNPFGIHVFTNNGAGVFAVPLTVSSGLASTQVELAVADFDADGDLDIFATSDVTTTGGYAICLNNGTGLLSVSASSNFASAGNAFGAAAGDIDNDGDIDLVYSRFGISQAFTLINDGMGNFTAGQTLTVGAQAYPVRLADIDNDGLLDLLAVRTNAGTNNIQIFKNTAGVFPGAPTQTVALPGTVTGKILTFDANGDGFLDIAASEGATQSVIFILNNAGTFGTPVSTVVGNGPHALATGDIDGDGDLDLFVTNSASNAFTTLINGTQPRFVCTSGCGSVTYTPNISPQRNVNTALTASLLTWQFTEPMTTATASFPTGTPPAGTDAPIRVWGSMTASRTPNTGAMGTWSYNAGATTATLTPARSFFPGEQVMVSVTTARSTARIPVRPYTYSFLAKAGVGPGTFFPPSDSPYPAGTAAFDVALADVDNDSDLDMAVANQSGNNVVLRLNDGTGGFSAAHPNSPFSAFAGVTAVRFGDVNNDGRIDMITCNNSANTVSVRLNNGTGNFSADAPGSPLAGGFNLPYSAALADVDGDGDLDLIVANDVGGNVSVRLNNGTGDFTTVAPGSPYAIGANTFGVVSGDVDNDGDIDIVATASALGATVLLNTGTGSFIIGSTFAGGTGVQVPILGDIDNDGDLDLAMPNSGSNTVTVRLNNGAGSFLTQPAGSPYPMGTTPRAISFADIDGDGDLDLLSANNNAFGIVVRLNTGSGVFSLFGNNSPISTGGLRSLALGDVDGDGDMDIAIPINATAQAGILMNSSQPRFVCTANCGSVTYTPNISPQRNVNTALTASLLTWQFTEPMTTATASFPTGMPPAGTNAPIRVWGSMTASRTPNAGAVGTWAYNAAATTATFTPAKSFFPGEEVMVSVTSAQNTSKVSARPYTYSFRAKAGVGPAVFVPQAQSPFATGTSPQSVALGDIDGDGDVDMVVAGSGGLIVRQNNGTGNFSSLAMIPTIANPSAIALGDADNDGDLDIVVSSSLAASNVSVLLNAGNGSFTTAVGSPMSIGTAPRNVAWGDADGDGDLDIAVADFSANAVSLLLNNGSAAFAAGGVFPTSGGVVSLRFADIDNDGDLDIAAANNSGTIGLVVLQNNGLGAYTLLAGTPIATPSSPAALTTGDVDGDGDIDVIVSANLSATATVLLNNGSGTYTVAASYATGAQSREVQLGDMDGDGDLDLIGVSANNNTVTVRLNNSMGDFTMLATAAPYSTGLSPQSIALGDVDGDGDLDIVTANQLSNTASVLLNQGSKGLAFSLVNVTAQEGFNGNNPTVLSRTSTPFTLGSFLGQTLLFPTTAILQYSIQALPGASGQFTVQGSSGASLNASTSISTQATFVWSNAPVGGGSTQAIITVTPTGATGLNSTQITVTVIAAPAYPLVLAMSQSSSTGTHGVNAGAFNAGQLQVVNGKPFNVAFGAWNGWGALAATQATVQAFLTGSGGETSGFTITNATVMLNNTASANASNLAISWDVPLAISTTITFRLSISAGAFLQSTSVNLVLTTTPLEPVITSFSPTTGATTSVVTVQGLNLGNVTALRVGGVPAQTFTINSPTQISIVVSTGATGFITATNLAGTGQSLVPFTFVVPPSGLMLSSTQAGVGQTITVSGNNIMGAQTVFVGGLPAMFSVTMSGSLLVIIPAGAQNGVVTVQTAGGSVNSLPLAIIPAPSIAAISPTTVSGGGMITITGANLTNVTSVTIGGIPVTSFTVISSTEIVAVVSTTAVSAPLQVQSAGGVAFSTTSIVVAVPPTVISVSNPTPTAGTQVFIGGSGFTPGMTVTIGGVPVPFVQVNSASEAIITMPASATNGTLSVVTPFGIGTFSSTIAVAPGVVVPASIDFTPVTGGAGTTVSIVGQGFVGVRDVSFGGVPVQRFTVESSTRIVAVISTGATGTARVVTTTGSAQSQRIFVFITPLQLDSLAAVSFFLMTDGFRWTTSANWLTRQPLQTWHGLTVQGGRITSIALPNNNVNGSLTSAVVQLSVLSALRTLNLSGSRLPGVLPSAIGTMRTLRTLNLSGVGLTGTIPTALAALDSLEVLRLDTNNLSGGIDTLLCSLGTTSSRQASRLREFRINGNQLSGVIPPCVVEFRQLEVLHLQNNRFTGTMPERIVELERLRELLLANNLLTGTVPRTFDRALTNKIAAQTSFFSTLERLDMSGNGFTGALPQGIAQFGALRELRLQDNAFTGALPQTLTALTKLEIFDASRNRFTGTLPEDIGLLRRLRQLSLTNTSISGSVPESLGECDLLERLELDSNALEGAMPTALAAWQNLRLLGLSRNRLTSVPTLTAALTGSRAQFEALRLASNRLTFESIEGNTGLKNTTYSPQDSIGTAQNLAFRPQSRIELNITIGGGSNRYQWFKNGVPFGEPSSSGFFLISQSATERENGVYECRVTNSLAPALTLYSRAWQIRVDSSAQAPTQSDALGQPTLLFPANNARFVSFAPLLRWSRGEGARQYEVQISTSASFTSAITTAIVSSTSLSLSALLPSVRYYWRVRSLGGAAGSISLQSAWSQALFTTANTERPLQMSSIDFERVPLRETSIREAVVANFSSIPQILRSIAILSDVQNDTNQVFRILDDVRDAVIPAGQSLTVKIAFTPRVLGSTSATSVLAYQQRPQDGARLDSTRNILQGLGGGLKMDNVDFDTVRTGGTSIKSADLVNLSSRTIRLKRPTIPDALQSENGVFAIESYLGGDEIVLRPLDTVQVVVRCRVPESSVGRKLAGVLVFGEGDSVQASIRAIARPLRQNDIIVNVGVKPRVDNIPPGGLVMLDVFLRTNPLTPVTVREVFRAIQPQFQGKFRMNRQVLALDGSEKIAFGQTLGDALSVIIPPTGLELSASEAELREARLLSVSARAVAGSTGATTLQVESASLAMPLIRAASAVFVEEPITGTFTAKLSQAGGKRLIGSVQQNTLQAIATKGALEITYSIAEAGTVDVSLYDILGRKIQTLSESYQEAGAYNGIFRMDNLFITPSGSYFIVLRTQSGIVQQRVDIIR
ncbi:MAG: VCBS repeat-containing protein [Ignavibacteria bacterium]|nr:VCBS repeat-containing protein [Ignavibacteria bacterium]